MDKNLTDEEIVKALEEAIEYGCGHYREIEMPTIKNALDLINRLQEKVEENEDTIQFADKIHKEQVAENKRLVNAVNRLTNRICDLKEKDETRRKVFETKCEELEIAKAENERLKKEKDEYAYLYDKHINTAFSHIKAEAYKEFAEKAENKILPMLTTATLEKKETICFCLDEIKNLLKELVGE